MHIHPKYASNLLNNPFQTLKRNILLGLTVQILFQSFFLYIFLKAARKNIFDFYVKADFFCFSGVNFSKDRQKWQKIVKL